MYNSNQGGNFNSNIFNNNSSNNDGRARVLLYLRILAGCIGGLAILKIIAGDYNGFSSDLMTCLFVFLTTYCLSPILAGFLVISLIFSVIMTSVFFALQLQNYIFDIPSNIPKNKLIFLYLINSLGLLFYSCAIYYCYKFYNESFMNSSSYSTYPAGYSLLNDNPATQQRTYGSIDQPNREQQPQFKAFSGSGVRLES